MAKGGAGGGELLAHVLHIIKAIGNIGKIENNQNPGYVCQLVEWSLTNEPNGFELHSSINPEAYFLLECNTFDLMPPGLSCRIDNHHNNNP